MSTFELRRFWIDVLLDDGEQWGYAFEGYTVDSAIDEAMQAARRHGLRPVCCSTITDNDTDETVYTEAA